MNTALPGLILIAAVASGGCSKPVVPKASPAAAAPVSSAATVAAAAITAEGLQRHIEVLAADDFEGRMPGSAGEEKTVVYLSEQFRALGLKPGNPDGSYLQQVPLVGISSQATLDLRVNGKRLPTQVRKDFVATTARFVPKVEVKQSELVFVGYGVQAPEYGWDDYKGLDVKGKTLVMLINDPAVPDPQDPSKLDPAMFKGAAMTYYGRWTYKYEIASRLGAAAAIIVHETEPAAYPWSVVESSWTGEQFELAASDRNMGRVPVQAWITRDKAVELFKAAGQDFDAQKQAALRRDFQPLQLKQASASFRVSTEVREISSRNVIARLPGSDPALADQHIVYAAHWDHLGVDPGLEGDIIFNGALDNASGVAGLLQVAKAYAALPTPPPRSVLFLAVTAEEQGLLGSRHYASHPLYPLQKTLAMINLDVLNPWGPTEDLEVIGYGQNTLEDIAADVLKAAGRRIAPDTNPDKGFYYRSDQFEFAKRGVPALYADEGSQLIGKPGLGAERRRNYIMNDYHKPSDQMKEGWDWSGAALDLRVLFEVGYRVASGSQWPQWKDGSEFKAIREAALSAGD